MAKYGIKITYSNGDEEDGLYVNFASKQRGSVQRNLRSCSKRSICSERGFR